MFGFFKKKEKTYFVTWIQADEQTSKMRIGARTVISAKHGTPLADECTEAVHRFIPNSIIINIQSLD